MNRRFPALVLTGALCLSLLSACGGTQPPAADPTPTPVQTETAAPSPADTPAVTSTPAPESTPAGTDNPAQTPPESASPKPQPTRTPAPTPPAKDPAPTPTPSEEESGDTDVAQTVWSRIESEIELPSLMDMDDEVLSALYGIDSADLETYIGKVPLMNVQATEFFIAQVKEGSMDTVKAGVERRQADLEAQWSTYLPEQLELVQNYKLITSGNYLFFAISYEADQAAQIFDDCTN